MFIRFLCLVFIVISDLSGQSKIHNTLNQIKNEPDTAQIKYLTDLCWKNRTNDFIFGIDCGEAALQLANKISNIRLEAKVLNFLGVIYRGQGDYDKSLSFSMSALSYAEQCADSIELAYAENNIGGTYLLKSYHIIALEHIIKGLKIFERLKFLPGIAYCQNQIGLVYLRIYNNDKALDYFEYCYQTRKKLNDLGGLADVLSNMVTIYLAQHNIELARTTLFQAEGDYLAINDSSGLISTWMGLGDIYLQQKNYKTALNYHSRSLVLAKKIASPDLIIKNENVIGIIYAQTGKYKLAEASLSHSLNLAYKFGDDYSTLSCLKAFSKIYELKGDFSNSLKYLNKYDSMKDSIITLENIKEISRDEELYKKAKAGSENTILEKNIEIYNTRRNYWIIIGILLTVSLIVNRIYMIKNRMEKEKQIIRRNIASDLHDEIGSNLSSISMLVQLASQKVSNEPILKNMLDKISQITRESSESIRDIVWFINPANDTSANLVDRIKECSSKLLPGIKHEINIPQDVFDSIKDLRVRRHILLILKEAITNTAKHSQARFMEVQSQKNDSTLQFIIRDNGIGIDEKMSYSGNGLTNMRQRAEQINAVLNIVSNKNSCGTEIELVLKLSN